jgi:acetoacetyl-CoA reductase
MTTQTQSQNHPRIAMVTGGLGGIGTGICIALAKAGHRVIACDVAQANVERWQQALSQAGVDTRSVDHRSCDVTDTLAVQAMLDELQSTVGTINVLVNCAGITRDASFRKMSKADWDAVMRTNLDSVFNVTKPIVEGMVAQGASSTYRR